MTWSPELGRRSVARDKLAIGGLSTFARDSALVILASYGARLRRFARRLFRNSRVNSARCASGAELKADLTTLETYLLVCVRRRDWHGVSDAANDIRVLEERIRVEAQR